MKKESFLQSLLGRMTLDEKIGQLVQVAGTGPQTVERVRRGGIGSCINVTQQEAAALQQVARRESRLGIPLVIGRDVIHGFRTIAPIPLGQACSFDPDLVRACARMAAVEAAGTGIHWTFSPMIDVSRDPRWGRVAEGFGEDPWLTSAMGRAMIEGYQGTDGRLDAGDRLAACAKHYAGYGAAEGGRDYNSCPIPPGNLHNIYLPPFRAAADAGAASFMAAFHEIDGMPCTGNANLIREILKNQWRFDGLVVSDWGAVGEMITHGFCRDRADAAQKAIAAGIDMEMCSDAFSEELPALVRSGHIPEAWIDEAVLRILRFKARLGLFDNDRTGMAEPASVHFTPSHLETARRAAVASCVLLEHNGLLPLTNFQGRIALIGPMADHTPDQLGCWTPDAFTERGVTLRTALTQSLGPDRVHHLPGVPTPRSESTAGIEEAATAARNSDVAIAVVGEDSNLSGEARSRAHLVLPGVQEKLLRALISTGTPVVAVIMAGRPLVLGTWTREVAALFWAWHPGMMGGQALADLILGRESPSGRLAISFPRCEGQIPVYYAHRRTGRPAGHDERGVPEGTPLDPRGFNSRYLDTENSPAYPFGYGLGYTTFSVEEVRTDRTVLHPGETLRISACVRNNGSRQGTTVVQFYLHDPVADWVRPVAELRGFQKITLNPADSCTVDFIVDESMLAYHAPDGTRRIEPGSFHAWIGLDATCVRTTPLSFEWSAE